MDLQNLRQRGRAKASHIVDKTKLRLTEPGSWALPKQDSSIAPPGVWTNADQDPVPPELLTWNKWSFLTYWYSDLATISAWSTASSIVATGLSATDAILIVLVAGICNAIPTVLNGCIGADLHIPFPIAARASYGYWLSYFCIISRGVLALFWFGVQSAAGGNCVTAMILAIWPSYADVPNHLPASIGVSSQGMCSYLIYWLLQFPLLLIPTHKLNYLFNVKAVLTIPMCIAMVVWISVKAGGGSHFFNAPGSVSGSARSWLWLSNLTAVTGSYSTLAVNISDFSRFSKDRSAPWWQLPFIPILKTLMGVFGVVSASASREIWGETLWDPIDIINKWQDNPGGRAAAFFCAAIWLLAQISVNISANAISFANDVTTLAPKWFNIRRGTIFVALFGGWALCPWIIMSSATAFLNFMSAYAIFMAPIAGLLTADYWLVKKRKLDVPALYDPHGIYRFGRFGVNWRALVINIVVIVPLLPALGNKVTPQNVPLNEGLKHLFAFNWLYGYITSLFLYWLLNYLFPAEETLVPVTVPGGDYSAIHGVEANDVESGNTTGEKDGGKVAESPLAREL
ncbi:nucleobase:cation symporter-1, NCS1 family [Geosmithia morbida]|uniref:Nucleobase:cation symporter-1, NCS1 family n=1 Tax=Geosmithia morbida TaxID=1094350 RepID=A0A9P4Z382_9HYPO|nr:nucleobase:cation symporter-1, NCS1 family [Geosmithia morbida]KAF4125819.1 nucleobase:cation symporter-1, NCS1 family [Geosmithia morbida]